MAIDSAAKRCSALNTINRPWGAMSIPSGLVDRTAALQLYSGISVDEPVLSSGKVNSFGLLWTNDFVLR